MTKLDGDVQEGQCVISENQMLDLISKNWEEHHDPLGEGCEITLSLV